MPFSAPRNSSRASTSSTGMPIFLNIATTRFGSPSRMMPLSMKTVFSRLPSALCPSAVHTELSTPPLSALIAIPLPTVFRIPQPAPPRTSCSPCASPFSCLFVSAYSTTPRVTRGIDFLSWNGWNEPKSSSPASDWIVTFAPASCSAAIGFIPPSTIMPERPSATGISSRGWLGCPSARIPPSPCRSISLPIRRTSSSATDGNMSAVAQQLGLTVRMMSLRVQKYNINSGHFKQDAAAKSYTLKNFVLSKAPESHRPRNTSTTIIRLFPAPMRHHPRHERSSSCRIVWRVTAA